MQQFFKKTYAGMYDGRRHRRHAHTLTYNNPQVRKNAGKNYTINKELNVCLVTGEVLEIWQKTKYKKNPLHSSEGDRQQTRIYHTWDSDGNKEKILIKEGREECSEQ